MNCQKCNIELNKKNMVTIEDTAFICIDCFVNLYDRELTREIKYTKSKGKKH